MENNLVLGRGKIFFDQFAAGTTNKSGERYLGSSSALGLSVETQDLAHYDTEGGVRTKDASATLQADFAGAMTIENISDENLALFFFGSSETSVITQAAGETERFVVTPGLYYQIGATDAKPEGLSNLSAVSVVVDPDGANTALVLDTDYELNADEGYVKILAGGAVSAGNTIEVTYTRDAQTQDRVISGNTPIEGALRYRSYNAVGVNRTVYIPHVVVRPNGELALKGEEWQNVQFNLEVLKAGNDLPAMLNVGRGVRT